MGMKPGTAEVLFVENDLYCELHGPSKPGKSTVPFQPGDMMQDKGHAMPDDIIYKHPELLNAVRSFENGDRRQTDG